jgi:hypothetical protein
VGKEWIPFIEWGYLVLLATLLQAGVISIVLIIAPLLALPRKSTRFHDKVSTCVYFTCLGLGYLFLEMVCIQKFTLFLANPVYAVSVVISSFLISSGFGSLYFEIRNSKPVLSEVEGVEIRTTPRTSHPTTHNAQLFFAVGGIIGVSLTYLLFLPAIFSYCSGWSTPLRILVTVVLIAPLGFCMGIPFPLGMKQVNIRASQLVPWAYGINGCASVLSSLIATCLAISWGFPAVILLAGMLYVIAAGTVYRTSSSL